MSLNLEAPNRLSRALISSAWPDCATKVMRCLTSRKSKGVADSVSGRGSTNSAAGCWGVGDGAGGGAGGGVGAGAGGDAGGDDDATGGADGAEGSAASCDANACGNATPGGTLSTILSIRSKQAAQ